MSTTDRYSRQSLVPGFSGDAQNKLTQTRILIVGCGGLGFAIAAQLAGAGIGHIELVDYDHVALSNLHRQWLYREQDIGLTKADCLAAHLRELNSSITVVAHAVRFSTSNAKQLLSNVDLVIDAADNYATSYLLDQHCQKRRALLTASVNQLYGYVGLFCAKKLPSFRAIFPRAPITQTSCDLVGVTGPAVTVVAGLQSQAALDYLLGNSPSLAGKLLYVDLRNYTFNLIDCANVNAPTESRIQFISRLEISPHDWVMDVREQAEIVNHRQRFPINQAVPVTQFSSIETIREIEDRATDKQRIVLACHSGQRALSAAQALEQHSELEWELAVILPTSE